VFLVVFEDACLKDSNGDQHQVEFFLRVGKDGTAENAQTQTHPDAFAVCLMRSLYQSFARKGNHFCDATPCTLLAGSGVGPCDFGRIR
jgi:hypothetical protein